MGIRPVDIGMAYRARLVLVRLVPRVRERRRVALLANRIHRGAIQQARIAPPVGKVACRAALGLDRVVLIHKRPGDLFVALRTDGILLRRRLQTLPPQRPMWIVAVRAHHPALFHLVMEGHGKLRPGIGVAIKAQRRLRRLQQVFVILVRMHAVAVDAAHVRFPVAGGLEARMLPVVAFQALPVRLFGRTLRGIEDLARIPVVGVGLAGAMAVLAGNALAMHLRHTGVRIAGEALDHFAVARGAGI